MECGRPGIRKSTRLQLQVSQCLCSSLSQSWDVLESATSRSFRLCCELGTSVTHEVAWVTDVPCSTILHQFSCIPLSLHKSLAMCLKESLHVIEFDRIAIPFSEHVSNCTNFLYCGEVFQVCCYNTIMDLSRSHSNSFRCCRPFERIHPLGCDVFTYRSCVCSRRAVCITSDPSSIVMKSCPFKISLTKTIVGA